MMNHPVLAAAWVTAQADVVWPALYLETRLFNPIVILIGLVVELVLVARAFRLPWRRALVATLAMNAASTLLGVLLIPAGGLLYEGTLGELVNRTLGAGTFNPVGWAATFLVGVGLNTAVEAGVLRYGFRLGFTWGPAGWLAAANAFSVAVAMLSLRLVPTTL